MADTSVIITGDTRQAQNSISELLGKLNALSGASGGAAGAMGALRAAAAPLAAAFSVIGIADHVKGIIDAADAMNDLSQRVGIGVGQLAAYELAAKQSGTSMEAVARGVKGLSGFMLEHADALKKAGITAKDADGALRQLSDIFSAMPDGMQKTQLAVKLFGKSGMELIPMLNMGSKGLQEAQEKTARYAEEMKKLAPQADRFNDQLEEIKMHAKVGGLALTNEMMPALNNITAAMAQAAKEGGLLTAIWVGLGGLMAETSKRPERSLAIVNTELAEAKKRMDALSQTRGQKNGLLNDLVNGSSDEQWQKANGQYLALLKERTGLENASAAAKRNVASAANAAAEAEKKQKDAQKKADQLLADKNAADAAASAYASLKNSLDERLQMEKAIEANGGKLNESDKLRIELLAKLAAIHGKISGAEEKRLKAEIDQIINAKQGNEEREKFDKLLADSDERRSKGIEAIDKETESIKDETQKIRDQITERLGGNAALEHEKELRLDNAITAEETSLKNVQADSAEAVAIRAKIAALMDQKKAMGEDILSKQSEGWKKLTEQVGDEFYNAISHGGEGGIEALKRTLKASALKVMVQAVVQPAMGELGGMLGVPGASGGASSLMSMAGSAIGTNVGSGLIDLSSATGIESIGDFGASMIAGEGAAGMLATAIPYLGVAMALSSMMGSNKKPAENTGDTAQSFNAAGALTGKSSLAMQSSSVDSYVSGMEATYLAAAKNLGIGTVATSFGMGSNTGKQGENPNTIIWGGAGAYGAPGSVNSGEVSSKDAAAVSLATSRAIFAALQGSEIPEYLKGYFNSLTASAMSQADIDNALAYGTALKSMREQVTETRSPAEILADKIRTLDASLGISAKNMDQFKHELTAAMDAGRVSPATLASWQELQATMAQSAELAKAVAAKQHDLDLQLLDATGKTAEATAARRSDALAALDNEQQRATQKEIWAALDAAAAKEKADSAAAAAANRAASAQSSYTAAVKKASESLSLYGEKYFSTMADYKRYLASAQRAGIDTSGIQDPAVNSAHFFQPKPALQLVKSSSSAQKGNADVVAALNDLLKVLIASGRDTRKTADLLLRVTRDGNALLTTAA